jgi:hypothetical protein
MKISVAYDNQGKILTASTMESDSPIQARPEAIAGTSVEDFEVPAEFARKKLHEFLPHLHVDVATRRLIKK